MFDEAGYEVVTHFCVFDEQRLLLMQIEQSSWTPQWPKHICVRGELSEGLLGLKDFEFENPCCLRKLKHTISFSLETESCVSKV